MKKVIHWEELNMKEKINSIQFTSTYILCLVSSSIGLSLYTTIKLAGHDSYIGTLTGIFMGIIPLLLFLYIFNYKKDLPLYEKTIYIFGKVIGTIINIFITLLYFIIGMTVLFNLGNFIVSQYLSDTPLLLVMSVFILVVFHIINKGIETITRVGSICIVIVLFLFLFSFANLFMEFQLDNLKPFLEFGLKNPVIGGFINMLIALSPMYSLLIIPKNNLIDKEKVNKYIWLGYFLSGAVVFLVSFLSNGVLGKYLIELYQYPGYISLKKISLFGFIDRIENFISLHWILSTFINLAMIVYFIKSNVKQKGNSKILNFIICSLFVWASHKVFDNNTVFNNYTYKTYPYFLGALMIIFLVICISIFVKKRIEKKNENIIKVSR